MDFNELVSLSVKHNASDLHLSAGQPVIFRVDGELRQYDEQRLSTQQIENWILPTLDKAQQTTLQQEGELDYALALLSGHRMRGNIFHQQRGLSAAYRHIPTTIPSLEQIALPVVAEQLLQQEEGLLLVTGATGSGKSTTLAALVETLNQRTAKHVVTLEAPIEFLHTSRHSLIQQREIGLHSVSFAAALRAALRQDPDILLLGELRDPETIRLALTAAETGHLVLASLHTRSAIQTVDRLVDVFPAEEKSFVRTLLAGSLRGVIAQCLLPRLGGGRVAVFEILVATPAVSNVIREGKTHQLLNLLQTGKIHGMQTLEQGIAQRKEEGMIAK